MRSTRWIASLVLGCLLALPVSAQLASPYATENSELAGMSLQELLQVRYDKVYSASRREQSLRDAPASVSLITAENIKDHGYRSLAEMLQSVPGVFVTYDRAYHFLGVRGFCRPGDYNSRVLLLMDGHRMNDNLYDMAMIEADYMTSVDLIDRVEVVNGPASSLYGNNAFFGVINVVTKRGAQLNGFEASSEYGSFDAWKGRLSYGIETDSGLDVLLSASYFDRAGPGRLYYAAFDNPDENNGVAERLDSERVATVQGHVSRGAFTLAGAFTRRDKTDPTGNYDTVFNDSRHRNRDETAYVECAYDREFENAVHATGHLAWHHYGYDATFPYLSDLPTIPGTYLNVEQDQGDWWGGDLQLRREFWDRFTATIGGEVRHNYRQKLASLDEPDTQHSQLNVDREDLSAGAFVQGDLRLWEHLTLCTGLRYDRDGDFGDQINPRIGLICQPRASTTFKALFGQAFRAPNVYEAYASYVDYLLPNPNLQPETIRTYELVWEQQLSGPLALSLSGYHYDITDLIELESVGNDLFQFHNVQEVRANGLTLGLLGAWTNGCRMSASYSVQRAENATTAERLSSSPQHLAKFQTRLPLWKDRCFLAPELLYVGAMDTPQGARLSDFWLVNLTFRVENLRPHLDASLGLYNLCDARYALPISPEHRQPDLQQDGLTFRAQLTYHF